MHIVDSTLNTRVNHNLQKVGLGFLIPLLFLLLSFFVYVIILGKGNFANTYIDIQKDLFLYLNGELSAFPGLEYNLTQLGDVLISFSLLSIFILFAPKLWEALITSALFSLLVSASLKRIFAVPRPAAVFDPDSFSIIGRTLSGNTSLPSGHSMAAFVVITVLLYAFMPARKTRKIFWIISLLLAGFFIVLSRVGVGAHYPFDVVIGSILGYMVAVVGIVVSTKITFLHWVENKKYYLVLIVLLLLGVWAIYLKILNADLFIFYFSLFAIIVSLSLIIYAYVTKD